MNLKHLALPVLAAALAMLGCASEELPPPTIGTQTHPITHGTYDDTPSHVAVVLLELSTSEGTGLCSGTLISPEHVLTAAHCVNGLSASAVRVGFGGSYGSMRWSTVRSVHVHPSYDSSGYENDIAIVRLSTAVFGTTPIPFLPSSLAMSGSDEGRTELVFSGFGRTENGETGTRLEVTDTVDKVCTSAIGCYYQGTWVVRNTICYDQQPGGPCQGDSGGPAFVTRNGREYVAGVTSYGDANCASWGCSTKVDAFASFVTGVIGTGKVLGEPCAAGSECASGFCADGVCCDAACGAGPCDGCSKAAGAGADGFCVHLVAACDDGDLCTTNDKCSLGVCRGTPIDCSSADQCKYEGHCVPSTGACQYSTRPDGTSCNDGDLCTRVDSCQGGRCVGSSPVQCPDDDPCKQPVGCDSATGSCAYQPRAEGASCDDGNACTDGDRCVSGTCEGAARECEPADACHVAGICDAVTGECASVDAPDGTKCDNGECRQGQCVKTSGCGCSESGAGLPMLLLAWVPALALSRRKRRG